ncbi:MAG TPA: hypothetical protein VGP07_01505 [Polyangia bacterium]|jgi:hypothetical protein
MQTLTVTAREQGHPPRNGAARDEHALVDVVKTTAADLLHLASAELKLVKLEAISGIRARSTRLAFLALGAVPLLVGYLFGVAALAVWLTPRWGLAAALGVTALSQVVIGAAVVTAASRTTAETGAAEKEGGRA